MAPSGIEGKVLVPQSKVNTIREKILGPLRQTQASRDETDSEAVRFVFVDDDDKNVNAVREELPRDCAASICVTEPYGIEAREISLITKAVEDAAATGQP